MTLVRFTCNLNPISQAAGPPGPNGPRGMGLGTKVAGAQLSELTSSSRSPLVSRHHGDPDEGAELLGNFARRRPVGPSQLLVDGHRLLSGATNVSFATCEMAKACARQSGSSLRGQADLTRVKAERGLIRACWSSLIDFLAAERKAAPNVRRELSTRRNSHF